MDVDMTLSNHSVPLVVCVDDDEAVLATIVRCLKSAPLEIRATPSVKEALAWIAVEDVAVLISDYDMPEMTGAQVAGHAFRLRPETVRILLTGKRTFETAIDGINQGQIFRFLSKPFENAALRSVVGEAIERNRELVAMYGDRVRRARREALRVHLEADFPGISDVPHRIEDAYVVAQDPWKEAALLDLKGLTAELESKS
jgi:DNA-binding NtrC family response regulator